MKMFPCFLRYNEEKAKYEKGPITPNKEDWRLTAERPLNDPAVEWHRAQLTGCVVPDGVVVIDLDFHKGITTEAIEQHIGAPVPWDAAHIQNTISGGAHFAFRLPSWPVRQGQNLGLQGFDTRVAGLGFICTGNGYTAIGEGCARMDTPELLPVLPDMFYPVLHVPQAPEPRTNAQFAPTPTSTLADALAHIDPTERSTWFAVGCAMKAHDEPGMFELWDKWSAGLLSPSGETPSGYNAETQEAQWNSFKVEREGRAISRGSLYYLAMQGGWTPPSSFDTSGAFADVSPLYLRIQEQGGDPAQLVGIVDAIRASGVSELARRVLATLLKVQLRDAGIVDKKLLRSIDTMMDPETPIPREGEYGNNDTRNALLFLETNFPDHTISRADEDFYRFNGKTWERLSEDMLAHMVMLAMVGSAPSSSRVAGCQKLVRLLVPVRDGQIGRLPASLMICNNGVYDLHANALHPHDKGLFTTDLLPFDYDPAARCPRWIQFLNESLQGDAELIALLQEWFGYLLCPDYKHQKIMLLLGTGRGGKGTIGHILSRLVGPNNFCGGSLTRFRDHDFLDSLRTKTVVFIGDAEKRLSRNSREEVVPRLKSISGNDEVSFQRKYKSAISTVLPTRITISSNAVPQMFDDSGALANRLLIIPFRVSFLGREDLTLKDKLEHELSGIANWAIEGWRRLQRNGAFTNSVESESEAEFVRESFSPIQQFIADRCEFDALHRCTSKELYDDYKAWAYNQGGEIISLRNFTHTIKESTTGSGVRYGTVRTDDERSRGFYGIKPVGLKGV